MTNYNKTGGNGALPEFISVISGSRCARIRINDIEAIEQEGRRLHVILADREYAFYENMKKLLPALAGRAFYRCIRGLVINFDHVRDISGNTVTFRSGQCVTMGKNSITRTRAAYKRYLLKYPPYSLWEGGTPHPVMSFDDNMGMQAAETMSGYLPVSSDEKRKERMLN